ncbi:solute carrier family 22 member 4 [Stylonychia lemnae]|uniref:Solute carrier family 22 member 4 n=1 Tax=Stylonychia lemnae TaxID=5949 RepID=A0A078AYE9_STYLE|nr:solute carrier family 22 member 4 [Stylonychia lemnae]|eukprot:CDW86242.1 solute carrier family 22 member 4 [Stylonychia lemnae]
MKQKGPFANSRYQEDSHLTFGSDFTLSNNAAEYGSDNEKGSLLDTKRVSSNNLEFNANLEVLDLDKSDSRDIDIQTDPSIEDYLENVCGFGRFQLITFFILYLVIQPTCFLLYSIPYLQLMPSFECNSTGGSDSQVSGQWYSCKRDEACENKDQGNFRYRIEQFGDTSLQNYVVNLGLECDSPNKLRLIGSFYFIGVILSIIIWMKQSEYFGKKQLILYGSFVQLMAYTGILFFQFDLTVMYLYYLGLGMGSMLTLYNSFLYLQDFTPKKFKLAIGNLFLTFQILPMIFISIYLGLFSSNSQIPLIAGYVLSIAGFVLLIPLPESPVYLFGKDQFYDCQESLNYVATSNNRQPSVDFTRQEEEKSNSSFQRIESSYKSSQMKWFARQLVLNNYNRNFVIFAICWIVVSFNYYLILFHFQEFKGSVYLNGFSSALGEIFGYLIVGNFMVSFGTKDTIGLSFIGMILSAIMYLYPALQNKIYYAGAIFIMKASISCAFYSIFIGTNKFFKEELTPTIFCFCNIVSRFFTILTPLVGNGVQDSNDKNSFMFMFISLSFIAIATITCINDIESRKKQKKSQRGLQGFSSSGSDSKTKEV